VNEELRDELLEMGRRDQEIRERIVPLLATVDFEQPPTEEWIALVAEQDATDQANLRRLEEIVNEFGWPGPALVGAEASTAAEVILNHAELPELRRLVPFLREAALAGQADSGQLAMAEDQIRVEEGRDQIYGTEFVNGPDGTLILHPIEDPASVDERRARVGLPPLEVYLNRMEEALGRPVER
jgi:hypothetical protein